MKVSSSFETKEFLNSVAITANYLKNIDKLKNKTILITGSTGLIGKMLVYSLMEMNVKRDANINVIATARNIEKAQKIFLKWSNFSNFNLKYLDINEKIKEDDFPQKIDYVVHASANTSSADMDHSPLKMIDSIFEGTRKLLNFAKNKRVDKFIYLSSMEVYGQTSLDDGRIKEDFYGKISLDSTRSSYPEAKRLTELLVLSYGKEYDFTTITLRPTQVIGAGVTVNDQRVFAEFTRQALTTHQIIMKTEGKTIRSYVYISDMINAILHVLCNIDHSDTFNVSNSKITISIAEMAKIIADIVGDTKIVIDSSDVEECGFVPELQMELSSQKLIDAGWTPQVNTKEMFNKLIKSFIEQGK